MSDYSEFLSAMQAEYAAQTGFSADDASDIGIRLKVLATQLAALSGRVETLKAEAFPQTASGGWLDYHAETRGLSRKAAAPSSGTLRLYRDTPSAADISVPEGVVCALRQADGEAELRFVTTAAGVLEAGDASIDLPARADRGGAGTNAAPGAVCVLVTPVQGLSGVTNPAAFSGGADAETDDQLRARLLRSFASISNGANAAFYYDFAMSFDGIASANVVPRVSGRGTVGVYLAGEGAPAPSELVQEIETQLSQAREINVDVTVESAQAVPVNLTLQIEGTSGVEFESLKAACTQSLTDFFHGLAVGQDLLLSSVGDALYHTEGLYNYKLTAPTADRQAEANQLFTLGTVTISRMAVVS